jgi:hypothetical protein
MGSDPLSDNSIVDPAKIADQSEREACYQVDFGETTDRVGGEPICPVLVRPTCMLGLRVIGSHRKT